MKKDAINAKIAELCGWSFHQIEALGMLDVAILPPGASIGDGWNVWKYAGIQPPDYHASLDACHEFEKGLTDTEWCDYCEDLFDVIGMEHPNDNPNMWFHSFRPVIAASAPQRCEAFLRISNQWTE